MNENEAAIDDLCIIVAFLTDAVLFSPDPAVINGYRYGTDSMELGSKLWVLILCSF